MENRLNLLLDDAYKLPVKLLTFVFVAFVMSGCELGPFKKNPKTTTFNGVEF